MKIRMPATRACYAASRNEPDRLLCWIPRQELEQLAADGRIRADVLEYYPSGLEVRLSRQGFAEFGLDLGVDPEELRAGYLALREAKTLPESGIVAGAHLEEMARRAAAPAPAREAGPEAFALPAPAAAPEPLALPEPEWTDGEDARTVMGKLR